MKFELSDEDKADLQDSIMRTVVGEALVKEIGHYLKSYELTSVIKETIGDRVRFIAREMIDGSEELQSKITEGVKKQIDDQLIDAICDRIRVDRY